MCDLIAPIDAGRAGPPQSQEAVAARASPAPRKWDAEINWAVDDVSDSLCGKVSRCGALGAQLRLVGEHRLRGDAPGRADLHRLQFPGGDEPPHGCLGHPEPLRHLPDREQVQGFLAGVQHACLSTLVLTFPPCATALLSPLNLMTAGKSRATVTTLGIPRP